MSKRIIQATAVSLIPMLLFLPYYFYKNNYQYAFWPPSISISLSIKLMLFIWLLWLFVWLLALLPSKPGLRFCLWVRKILPASSPAFWLLLFTMVWFLVTTYLTLRGHALFNIFSKDTAMLDQAFWSARKGESFFNSSLAINNPGGSIFGLRSNYVSLIFFPFYLVWPNQTIFILVSNAVLAAAVIPIFFMARRLLGEFPAALIAIAYLLHPTVISQAAANDVHDLNFLPLLFMLAFWAFFRQRFWLFLIMAAITLTVKEDITGPIAMFGIYALLIRRPWKWVAAPILLACTWLIAALKLVVALNVAGAVPRSEFYSNLGNGWSQIAANVVIHPIFVIQTVFFSLRNIPFIYFLFISLGLGVPAFSAAIILFLPSLAEYLLASSAPNLSSWYLLVNVATIMPALILGIAHFPERLRDKLQLTFGISVASMIAAIILMVNVSTFYIWLKPEIYVAHERSHAAQQVINNMPGGSSIIAPKYMAGDLAKDHYLIDYATKSDWPWPEPDYIVIDTESESLQPENNLSYYYVAKDVASDQRRYKTVETIGNLIVYKKVEID